jgi:hypothetical protein
MRHFKFYVAVLVPTSFERWKNGGPCATRTHDQLVKSLLHKIGFSLRNQLYRKANCLIEFFMSTSGSPVSSVATIFYETVNRVKNKFFNTPARPIDLTRLNTASVASQSPYPIELKRFFANFDQNVLYCFSKFIPVYYKTTSRHTWPLLN